jgi:hypothetical protein
MKDLFFLHDDNGVYTDYTLEAQDYIRDDISISYVSAEDSILIGLYKPFPSVYLELISNSTQPGVTYEYSTETGFDSLDISDFSNGFKRSGFIEWQKPNDWEAASIDGKNLFYIRIKFDADTDIVLRGLNIVFADDNDLKAEMFSLGDNFHPVGESSFISYHAAARNDIIQTLRNSGKVTRKDSAKTVEDFTKWDILEPKQVRQAAKYLALSKIMFDTSNDITDKYYQRYTDYLDKYGQAFKLYLLTWDADDDGIADNQELNYRRSVRITRS